MKKERIFAFLMGFCLCFSLFSLTGCKDNTPSTNNPNSSEDTWSDENVDNNGWT